MSVKFIKYTLNKLNLYYFVKYSLSLCILNTFSLFKLFHYLTIKPQLV